VKLLDNRSYYWTDTAHFYLSQIFAYSPDKNALSMKTGHAGARLILVRDLL
jgi:hypothetical protein